MGRRAGGAMWQIGAWLLGWGLRPGLGADCPGALTLGSASWLELSSAGPLAELSLPPGRCTCL